MQARSLLRGASTALGALTLLLAGCSLVAPATPTAVPKIKVAFSYDTTSASQAPWWIAKDAGLWDKYGLDVDMISVDGGQLGIKSVLAGSQPMTSAGGPEYLKAAAAGGDLVMLLAVRNVQPDILVTTADIKTPEDLKGKKVAISTFGAAGDFVTKKALIAMKLDPDKDVTRLQIGTEGPRLAAVQAGTVSAGMQGPEVEKKVKSLGMNVLVKLSDLNVTLTGNGLVTTRKWLGENREAAKRFAMGVVDAIHYWKTNKAGSLPIMAKYMKTDPETTEIAYDAYVNLVPDVPYVDRPGFQNVIDFVSETQPEYKGLNPEKFIDDSVLKDLETSGFLANVSKQ